MKRIPKFLEIGPHTFTVRRCSPEDMEAPNINQRKSARKTGRHYTHFGSMNYADLEIMVNEDMSDDVVSETLWHESVHALVEVLGLDQLFKRGTEEAIVQPLAAGIVQLLRDNPVLRRAR